MLLTFFLVLIIYLLSMSEVIQEIFKESSVNNPLKSVPNDSYDIWQSLALNTSALFGSDAWLEPLGFLINAKLLRRKINLSILNPEIFCIW